MVDIKIVNQIQISIPPIFTQDNHNFKIKGFNKTQENKPSKEDKENKIDKWRKRTYTDILNNLNKTKLGNILNVSSSNLT